ncbi:DegT/DnrJ/EryC1/StrS family aminotransferase [Corynebacterium gerontici]|uniref:UDP-4-amino-4-deoxy-L-arabinose--oxoglutarate aminotransferase n=1 Tax=Corynebacterium gerontici TaxID=2079234 RepID=A0A3G6J229_9CORY|nr:DegT/DnrJ/EryC1/StrS family aminotransferase [Corynebacterium gerontici]AZA10440.1 UDP-4-amino-4-deoxy-L-arabinose--oxoglutarate aminotransferase [Corynebacterium gerontici]
MSHIEPIPFAIPDITDREVEAAAERVRSGWLTTGPATRDFERDMVAFLGDDSLEAIAVNSATAGLHLALEAVGVGPGDEVLVPDWTFTSTAEVVRYLGATPVLVDVSYDTLNICLEAAERAITERTKAIVPVHFAGLAVDAQALADFARKHALKVVEDAAHALPSTSNGALVGTSESDAIVYSFYATKTITTGEGGMVITRDPELASRMRVMRLHGISRDVFDRYTSTRPSWEYDVVAPGFKYNMGDVAAAIGRVQLDRGWEMQRKRQAIAQRYDQAFADLPLLLPAHAPEDETHSWHLYVVRIADGSPISRDELVQALSDAQIGTSMHFIPLHRHSYWAQTCAQDAQVLPNAEASYHRAMSLPLFSAMSNEQIERVIAAVRRAFGKEN